MASSVTQSGGYDYEFVDTNLPDEFQCPICTLVPRDVHQASCCGKMFCKSCLDEWKTKSTTNYTCPNCREDLTNNHFFKDLNTNRKIRNLLIHCTNKKCIWKGSLQDIEKHLSTCAFQIVECSNKCGTQLKQSNLENHLVYKCPKRIVSCVYCHKEDEYQIINGDHNDVCTDYPLPCPNNGCENKIKRHLMTEHKDTCPKEEVDCQYFKVGCYEKMKRENLPQHNKENIEAHLCSAVHTIVKLKQQHQSMEEQLREGNHNIEKLKHTIKQLEQQKDHTVTKIKIVEFEALRYSNRTWYSPGFHTHLGGYKLRVVIIPNGSTRSKCPHVSCYINLMPGEYDDILDWPFQGVVIVELLNQVEDENHYKRVIFFNDNTPDKTKNKMKKENTNGWGQPQFIPHTDLGLNSSTNTQYLMNDTLYFRVSVNVHSKTKPWLAGVI